MRDLGAGQPGTQLWVVLGADAARQTSGWHEAGELLGTYHFVLVNRAGEAPIRHAEAIALGFLPELTRWLASTPRTSPAPRSVAASPRESP